jgi:MFS family permease
LALSILIFLGIIAFLDRQIISLMVDRIKLDLHISDLQISLLQGLAFGLLYCSMGLPIGYAVDRFSRTLVIFLGVTIWALAATACGFATTYSVLLVARIWVGVGEAALAPAGFSILSDLFPRTRLALALSIYQFGSMLGSSAALMIGSTVLGIVGNGVIAPWGAHLAAWQVTFMITGIPGLALGWVIFLVREPARRHVRSKVSKWSDVRTLLRDRRAFFITHFAGFSLCLIMVYADLSWVPVILQRSYGWSIGEVGFRLSVATAITGTIGLLVNGMVVDWMFAHGRLDAHVRYYALMMIPILISGLVAPFMRDGWLYLVGLVPIYIFLNFAGVSAAAVQIVTPPSMRGRMSAIYLGIISVTGLVIGPSAPALITDYVFHDPSKAILSLAIVQVVLTPLAGVLFFLAMGSMREAVIAQAGGCDP